MAAHYQDIILVKNIDTDCTDKTYDVRPKMVTTPVEEDPTMTRTEYLEQPTEFNHADYFEVRWGGQPFRLKPGEEKVFPRFVAEQFAKYLTTHLLQKRAAATNSFGLINNALERQKLRDQILVSVVSSYGGDPEEDEGLKALQATEEAQRAHLDLGTGSDIAAGAGQGKVLGELTADTPASRDMAFAQDTKIQTAAEIEAAANPLPEGQPLPSRAELVAQAAELGIEVGPKDNKDVIAAKIRNF